MTTGRAKDNLVAEERTDRSHICAELGLESALPIEMGGRRWRESIKVWISGFLVFLLLLFLAAWVLLDKYYLSDSTQQTYKYMRQLDQRERPAEDVFADMRAMYVEIGYTDVAIGVVLSAPLHFLDGDDQVLQWVGFVCFLADRGEPRAIRELDDISVVSPDRKEVRLSEWLSCGSDPSSGQAEPRCFEATWNQRISSVRGTANEERGVRLLLGSD